MISADVPAACPSCREATVTHGDAAPWCSSRAWNLDAFEAGRRGPEFGWSRVDRFTHRVAYRLTRRQFTALVDKPLEPGPVTVARVVTLAAAALTLGVIAALTVAGLWLLLHDFPRPATILGAILLLALVYLRPRFGRLDPEFTELDRTTAPALFDLVERVCVATGAAMPDLIGVDGTVNAYSTTVGIRRRRVLCLGLPLWSVLDPQERVALVGHELGHFVNGDVRRGLLTQVAVRTLGQAAMLTAPGGGTRGGSIIEIVADALAHVLQWTVSRLLFGVHLVILWVSQRDSQRAEYLADEFAARAAGAAAAERLCQVLTLHDSIDMVICREARAQHGPAAWRAAADEVRRQAAPSLKTREQLTCRDQASLFASHPPTGLRSSMLARRPNRSAAVVLTEQQLDRIDGEPAGIAARTGRDLAAGH